MLNGNDLELLSAYIDEALSASERADLEARLQTDASLRRELERLQATKALIASLPTLSPPRDLRLTRAMVGRSASRQRVLTSAAFSALSAAAAVILLVIGVGLFMQTGQQPEPNAVTANRVVALPTEIAAQTQLGILDEIQAEMASTPEQFGNVQAEQLAPDQAGAESLPQESESAANDQSFEAPAGAPQPAAPAIMALPSASPSPAGTPMLQFAVPATQIAAEGSGGGVVSDAQLRAGDQADTATSGLAASAPVLQATLNPSVIMLTSLPSATAKPSATPTRQPSLTPLPTATPPALAKTAAGGDATVSIGLIALAVLLLGAAVGTTILRRRG